MKKFTLVVAGLMMFAGTSFAAPCGKHKDKAACSKTAKADCKEKACCKKNSGTAKTETSKTETAKAETVKK